MSIDHFNALTPAEDERLAILLEECGEVLQAIGKIQRHGYESNNNGQLPNTNRITLNLELGDLISAIGMLADAGDIDRPIMLVQANRKKQTIKQWLHHQAGDAQ